MNNAVNQFQSSYRQTKEQIFTPSNPDVQPRQEQEALMLFK